MSDSSEIARIRAKTLRLEETVSNISVGTGTTPVQVSGAITSSLTNYPVRTEVSGAITGALTPYATLVGVTASFTTPLQVSGAITGGLVNYPVRAEVSGAITGGLVNYPVRTEVSGAITASLTNYPIRAEVSGAITASGIVNSGLSGYIAYYPSNGSTVDDTSVIYTNGTNVGVGTASPSTKLDVNGTIKTSNDLITSGTLYLGTAVAEKDIRTATNTGGIRIYSSQNALTATPDTAVIQIYGGASGGNGSLYLDAASNNNGAVILRTAPTAGTITERMRINSAGNVGIGTNNPQAILHANGSTTINSQVNVAAKIGANLNSDVLIGSVNGNTPYIASQGAYPLTFYTNATERARIDSAGNVGVGTTSPSAKLEVSGNIKSFTGTQFGGIAVANATNTIGQIYGLSSTNDGGALALFNNGNSDVLFSAGNFVNHYIATGSLGLGTKTPTEKLEVVGAIKIPIASNVDNDSPGIVYISNDDFLYNTKYLNQYGFGFHLPIGGGGGAGSYISGFYGIDLFTGGSNRLTIDVNGAVGIGSTSPNSRLEVRSNTTTELSITSEAGFGASRLSMYSDRGLVNEWRPAYMQSADGGSFTGRLDVYTNGTGAGNKLGSVLAASFVNGAVGIATTGPTQTLDVNGTVRVRTFSSTAGVGTVYRLTDGTLSLTAPSDIRFKKDIINIDNALEKVKQIKGIKFKWDDTRVPKEDFGIDPALVDKYRIGVLAQDVEKIFPELVFKHQEGKDYLAVSYPEFTAVLIEAVKELSSKNDMLLSRVEALENIVSSSISGSNIS